MRRRVRINTRFQNPAGANRAGFFVSETCPEQRPRIKGLEHGKFGHNIQAYAFYGRRIHRSFLERQGIQVVTGIPGGSILPV
jgi:hypothetical protein